MTYPRITQTEFAERRSRLLEQLPDDSAVLMAAASECSRNNDVNYPFRQDSDFYYLTGFNEPDAWLVLSKRAGVKCYRLFVLPRDREKEIWHGYRVGPERAVIDYGADEACAVTELDEEMPDFLEGIRVLYCCLGVQNPAEEKALEWLRALRQKQRQGVIPPSCLGDLSSLIHEMRLVKSPAEIAVIKAACEISAQAHVKAMQRCRPGLMEYQLDATLTYHFADQGCEFPAYSSIVGGGKNGCILHYVSNREPLQAGDLVLIDAGCEWDFYAGDITRTFPVSGRFSEQQKALYNAVLAVQECCIEAICPGVSWDELHAVSVREIIRQLLALGILSGDLDELYEQEAHKPFYMHRIGHWLGMDVHDVGSYQERDESRALQPGMVLTIEPGIYIAPDNLDVDPKWRGIGIRIEDDLLVTEAGREVLTATAPKQVGEIEELMAQQV